MHDIQKVVLQAVDSEQVMTIDGGRHPLMELLAKDYDDKVDFHNEFCAMCMQHFKRVYFVREIIFNDSTIQ